MLQFEVLVVKLLPVDRFTTSTIEVCKITALDHEALDDSVEDRSFIAKSFAGFAFSLLACT